MNKKKAHLQADRYSVNIQWSSNDNSFVATVPALPGCIATADTREAALREIKPLIQDFLEIMEESGDPIPSPDTILEDVRRMLPLINLSKLARVANVNRNSLATRLRRQAAFPPDDARKIRMALQELVH